MEPHYGGGEHHRQLILSHAPYSDGSTLTHGTRPRYRTQTSKRPSTSNEAGTSRKTPACVTTASGQGALPADQNVDGRARSPAHKVDAVELGQAGQAQH
eukprot:3051008-Amphidinium_carterae.1